MNNSPENRSSENQTANGDAATPWDILKDNNNNPFDLDNSATSTHSFTAEELAQDNPFNVDDELITPTQANSEEDLAKDSPFNINEPGTPAGPFTAEELAQDNPFDIDAAPDLETPASDNPFEV